jgi:hypothetical protein
MDEQARLQARNRRLGLSLFLGIVALAAFSVAVAAWK